jgi:uncharacterized membrane protein
MKHLHDEVRVEAPVERVWAFYCDTSNWHDFMPRATFSEFSGPVDEVGTTYVTTMRLMGFDSSQTSEVIEVEPLRLIREHIDDGPVDMVTRFEPDGEATRVVVESDYDIPGRWPGFIKELMSRNWVERQTHQMLADFKALAEAEVPTQA